MCASAFCGSSQNPGARVFSSSLAISIFFESTSKILPQVVYARFEGFGFFGCGHDFVYGWQIYTKSEDSGMEK
jgi:hypothetical protein